MGGKIQLTGQLKKKNEVLCYYLTFASWQNQAAENVAETKLLISLPN